MKGTGCGFLWVDFFRCKAERAYWCYYNFQLGNFIKVINIPLDLLCNVSFVCRDREGYYDEKFLKPLLEWYYNLNVIYRKMYVTYIDSPSQIQADLQP